VQWRIINIKFQDPCAAALVTFAPQILAQRPYWLYGLQESGKYRSGVACRRIIFMRDTLVSGSLFLQQSQTLDYACLEETCRHFLYAEALRCGMKWLECWYQAFGRSSLQVCKKYVQTHFIWSQASSLQHGSGERLFLCTSIKYREIFTISAWNYVSSISIVVDK
jgi:hypothetical protein